MKQNNLQYKMCFQVLRKMLLGPQFSLDSKNITGLKARAQRALISWWISHEKHHKGVMSPTCMYSESYFCFIFLSVSPISYLPDIGTLPLYPLSLSFFRSFIPLQLSCKCDGYSMKHPDTTRMCYYCVIQQHSSGLCGCNSVYATAEGSSSS